MDIEKVKQLISGGKSGSEIAAVMGVSRQRISQVLRKHGLSQHRVNMTWEEYRDYCAKHWPRGPRKQVARVITGGVEQPANTVASSKICELLVAADLTARGWRVFMPLLGTLHGCHDVVAVMGETVLTFEVRAAVRRQNGALTFKRDKTMRSDHYAVVPRGAPVEYEPALPELVQSARPAHSTEST